MSIRDGAVMWLLMLFVLSQYARPRSGVVVADCYLPGGIAGAIEHADAVFTGHVLRARRVPSLDRASNARAVGGIEVRIAVDRIWKGSLARTVLVRQNETEEDLPLARGRRYLVFAKYGPSGALVVAPQCAGTRPWPVTRAERDSLGAGRAPSKADIVPGKIARPLPNDR